MPESIDCFTRKKLFFRLKQKQASFLSLCFYQERSWLLLMPFLGVYEQLCPLLHVREDMDVYRNFLAERRTDFFYTSENIFKTFYQKKICLIYQPTLLPNKRQHLKLKKKDEKNSMILRSLQGYVRGNVLSFLMLKRSCW